MADPIVKKSGKAEKDSPQDLARITEQHGTDITDLTERLTSLEERFGDNEKIAKTLTDVSGNIKNFDQLFEKVFVGLLRTSTDIKSAFRLFVDECDRDATNKLLKRFGVISVWVVSLIITAFVTAWVTKKVGQ